MRNVSNILETLWMLAESTQHFKVAVSQGVRYACFRENWVGFRGAIELPFGISAANSKILPHALDQAGQNSSQFDQGNHPPS